MRRPKRTNEEEKRAYIAALTRGLQPDEALRESRVSPVTLGLWRRGDDFAAQEMSILAGKEVDPGEVRFMQARLAAEAYAAGLKKHYGNQTKARQDAGVTKKELEAIFAANPEMKEWCDEAFEALGDDVIEQVIRVASGAKSDVRDTNHLRHVAAKLRPAEWGEKAKEVNVHYSGKLTLEDINAEIARLEQGDDMELLTDETH